MHDISQEILLRLVNKIMYFQVGTTMTASGSKEHLATNKNEQYSTKLICKYQNMASQTLQDDNVYNHPHWNPTSFYAA